MSGVAIAKDMGIGVSTLYGWRAKEADIRQQAAVSMPGAKSTKGAEFAKVDQAVMEMLVQARALRMPVDRDAIHSGAKLVHSGFNPSEGWVEKFVKRNDLHSRTLHGEAGRLRVIRETCAQYVPECVYNADETGLCYRIMPKATYLAPSELKKTVRGVKGMRAKDRVTAYMATSASGRKPRCFKIRGSPIKYFSQKNAWSVARVFKLWWSQVFLPHVRSVTSEKVLLIMDNHSSHADLVDPKEQLKILELPPNCTRKHQPRDAGIIAAWKVRYRTKLLGIRVDTMTSAAQLREQAKERKVIRGCMGLAERAQPHILDAAELGLEAWKEALPETIKRCWRKFDILPPAVNADLDQDVGKNIRNKKESLQELTDLVQRLSLEAKKTAVHEDLGEALKGLGLAPGAAPTRASMEAAQTWLRVEEKEGVAEAIIADLKDDLCEESLAHLNMDQLNIDSDDDEADSLAGDEGQCTQPLVSPRPPPYADVSRQFGDLEEIAERCSMAGVAYHLRKAKIAWMSEAGSKKTKQTCMADSM
ncbi:unnamed protein product [Ectocarpus sp. CCAP 1310/34]|nr:unnamed protein product [Ectocarpus sp. CCAP 1310/34]